MNKKQKLYDAIQKFEKSQKTSADYLKLSSVIALCLRQGSGLVWREVNEATILALNNLALDDDDVIFINKVSPGHYYAYYNVHNTTVEDNWDKPERLLFYLIDYCYKDSEKIFYLDTFNS